MEKRDFKKWESVGFHELIDEGREIIPILSDGDDQELDEVEIPGKRAFAAAAKHGTVSRSGDSHCCGTQKVSSAGA